MAPKCAASRLHGSEGTMSENSRRHPRIPFRRKAVVEFAVWSVDDDTPRVEVDGSLCNVSRGGLAVAAEMPPETRALLGGRDGIRPGLALTVRFRVKNRSFALPGAVAWAETAGGRALLGIELRLDRASKATRRAFESWTAREERERGLHVADDPAREALVERLCTLIETLEGVVDRISNEHVDPRDAEHVDHLAEALQSACTVLELSRVRERLKS